MPDSSFPFPHLSPNRFSLIGRAPGSVFVRQTVETKGLSMYWSNQEIDSRTYPALCPSCEATRWLDFDWETGLGYCRLCGWDPDNFPSWRGEESA